MKISSIAGLTFLVSASAPGKASRGGPGRLPGYCGPTPRPPPLSNGRTMDAPGSRWWHGATLYQIYVRSWQDTNDDGYGDLNGVTAHLDYLAWLGADGIWLSPTMPSPDEDWGYDVSDYQGVHPELGTIDDLDALIKAAGQRGMRVLLDLVPNHTSSQHPWFVESAASRQSPLRDYYVWADPMPGGGPPNNWLDFTRQSAWEWHAR